MDKSAGWHSDATGLFAGKGTTALCRSDYLIVISIGPQQPLDHSVKPERNALIWG